MLTCTLSGSEPREPVVSPYGHLYERSVITDYLKSKSECPITGQPLSPDHLISIAASPRPLVPTTLPDLLTSMTSEFNRLIEERWKFQASLQDTREQLAVALFRLDAASRLVARLTRERHDLLHRLSSQTASVLAASSSTTTAATTTTTTTTTTISSALPAWLASESENIAQRLQSARREAAKTRKSQAPTREAVENFAEISDSPVLHVHGGISAVRLQGRDVVATVGTDLHVQVVRLTEADLGQAQVVASLGGAGVSASAFHGDLEIFYSGDEEGKVVAWRGEQISTFSMGEAVVGISVHPSRKFLLAATASRVVFLGLNEKGEIGNQLCEYKGLEGRVTAAGFHPDGLLMGVAVENADQISSIVIFDVRSGEEVARLEGHQGRISDFRFGENGYMLVSADEGGRAILWDLRKSAVIADLGNFHGKISVAMDESCQYIAVAAGQTIRIFGFTGKTDVSEISSCETGQNISDIIWLPGARGLLLGGSAGKLALVASR